MANGQRKIHSALETAANTISGIIVSFLVTLFVFPLVGIHSSASQNAWAVLLMTVTSVLRSYVWRRTFNWLHTTGKL